jgi:hypothetical protein
MPAKANNMLFHLRGMDDVELFIEKSKIFWLEFIADLAG